MGPKKKSFSEWYDYVLKEGEFIDVRYGVKGMVVYRPRGMAIVSRLYQMFESDLKERGHQQVLFPLMIGLPSFKKESDHIKGFEEEVFMVSRAGGKDLDEPMIIRPTSETAFYPMFELWISSYRDLPYRTFQSVAVYRYETKATRPLFRGREFLWIETHNLFASEADAIKHVRDDIEMMSSRLSELGIPYLVVKREPYDRFPGADQSYAYDAILPTGEVLQVATTHYLGQNFTKPFEVEYLAENGDKQYAFSTTLGIGISRILGALVSCHGDDNGAYIPPQLSDRLGVVVPILSGNGSSEVMQYVKKVYSMLPGGQFLLDDSELTPGEKYYMSELKGYPLRIEIGIKEARDSTATIFRRDTRKRKVVSLDSLPREIDLTVEEMKANLKTEAEGLIHDAASREEIIELSGQNRIIRANFCGKKPCADGIKDATGGYEVRGELFNEEQPHGACAWCGEKAVRKVILAKAY
ncbi:MAG: His/Gly/Thr/Pro-type tRNA ligase C-terminal domain-containing protein [Thaumarchaeota archaeon]|nr:His/Gly/Thr/Pro-type tRNA ligase C-terminal domain-containing protein [Nitrososphaerota archaeon]MDG6932565.1 proline--tRNA ligase [Nitrososphaerota archaeon]